MNSVQFVELVENRLGYALDMSQPEWKARMIQAGRVNRKRAEDPEKYSWENLQLTVDYLARKHTIVHSPVAVCYFVDEALRESPAVEKPVTDLTDKIRKALAVELDRGDDEWVERLIRATGDGRQEVYDAWALQRGVR